MRGKRPTAVLLHQQWELQIMNFVIFYLSNICSEECCTWPTKNKSPLGRKNKKRHWYAFDFIKLLCHNKGGRWPTLHSGRCKVEQADGGCSCSWAGDQPGDWLLSPSGPSPSQWGIHSQAFLLWQLIRLGSNQSQRFTLLLLWLLPVCVFFPPHLNLNCPPGNLSAIKEKKGHWIIVMRLVAAEDSSCT